MKYKFLYLDRAKYVPTKFRQGLILVLKESPNKIYAVKLDLIPETYLESVLIYFKNSKDFNMVLDKNYIIKFTQYVEEVGYVYKKSMIGETVEIDRTEIKKVIKLDKSNIKMIIEKLKNR